ncbi:response regulator [Echinicola jeungdonensis]|uniref:Response regulator transcription factor n=1 Tax=Echinicola jeungdonensis TaxID=709343 RepID=A0ABV5J609_9BACT|nr:response regulator [Echinicola jeungdonensis]MDN3668094.1 response regulator [Echinicola jeungdonensis]
METITILVIEDNAEMCENISDILRLKNYQIITAQEGLKGLEMVNEKNPDLVICDVKMPKLDGFGVLKKMKSQSSTSSIPFIFLTAKAQKVDLVKGMEMGANEYIVKPFDGKALLEVVESCLETHINEG